MRVILAVAVDTLKEVSHLRPALGWNSPYLTYMIKCDHCGNVGTVRIRRTMGAPIVREKVPMPVMLLEVMGLALDYHFVDFRFKWTVRKWLKESWKRIDPFDLENGSFVVPMNERNLGPQEYPPMVIDVEGFYMPAN